MRGAIVVLVAVALLATLQLVARADAGVDVTWGVKIPTRDGIRLNATIYKPAGLRGALPVVFTFTPYVSDSYHPRAWYFAQHGYVFALVDVRGRGNSEGVFVPFENEGHDGYDVVEWLARQAWCNGKVAMWGGSYGGFDQWTTLKENPPHLKTIVPVAAIYPGVDAPFLYNIFYQYVMQWVTYTSGVTPNDNLFSQTEYWIQKFRELALQHLPFDQLDRIVGNPSPAFHKWIDHPMPDVYYDAVTPTPAEYAKMDLPILTITGDYDGSQPGTLTYYRALMHYAAASERNRSYLIIGPWDHAGTRTPQAVVGGLRFGQLSLLNMNELHRQWYDWTLKGGNRPAFLKKQVAYYVTGAEKWKYANSLTAIGATKERLYLSSDGLANDAFHSGRLTPARVRSAAADRFVYDPMDTQPAQLETGNVDSYLTDERYALNLFGNGVVYHTDQFSQDTEVSGFVRFVVWMSMDVPDTDFQTTLYQIMPDGTSVQLTSDAMRARYRDSLRTSELAVPNRVYRYEFSHFTFFSREITKGSRLRLVIQCPNTIYSEKNYNTGGVVEHESGKDAKVAHVTVYHDPAHASFYVLPIVK